MCEEKKPPEPDEPEYSLSPEPDKKPADEAPDAGGDDGFEYELAAPANAEPAAAEFLEVEEPPKGPPPPPPAPPFPAAARATSEPPRRETEAEDEPVFDDEPPRLSPFETLKFLVWPLRHGNADDFLIALGTILVLLLGGWLLGQIPMFGRVLQAFVATGIAIYFFTYLVKVVQAAAEGRHTPSIWVQPGLGDAGMSEGVRATILAVAYGFPALAVGLATQNAWWGFPLALLAWAAFPAILLNLAASGGMEAANPIDVWRTATLNRRLYLRILIPGAVFLLTLFISSGWLSGVWFGVAMWLALVYTALAMGLFAYHDERLAVRVAEFSGVYEREPGPIGSPAEE